VTKKISPTLIGAFVVGAIALAVVAVIAFGSGRFFRKTKEFVLFFDENVNGLHVGAPVKFKGVEIGSVKNILLQINKDMRLNHIPVIIEIDLKKITARGASGDIAENWELVESAIRQEGLRGQLQTESLVTGVLYIALDFFPGTPINLVQNPNADNKYPEIPTVPTELEQAKDAISRVVQKLEEIDFKAVIASVTKTVDGVDQFVNSPALKSALRKLDQTLPKIDEAVAGFHQLTIHLDGNVTNLTANFQQTSDATRQAMQQAEIALKQTDVTLKEAQLAMANVKDATDSESPTAYELRKSLQEVSAAARSLRLLTDSIGRNPRMILFGKPEVEEAK
jgi:paraquat-inducible protein B